jgi:hypothetical protein
MTSLLLRARLARFLQSGHQQQRLTTLALASASALVSRNSFSAAAAGDGAAAAAGVAAAASADAPLPATTTTQLPLLHPARLQRLLSYFPPAEYGFAYGSGAFEQPELYPSGGGGSSSGGSGGASSGNGNGPASSARQAPSSSSSSSSGGGPLLDLIFAVEDPRAWHAANLAANPSHYSGVSRHLLGPAGVDWVARRVGAAVHFNTLVKLQGGGGGGSGGGGGAGGGGGGDNDANNSNAAAASPPPPALRVKYGVIGTSDLVEDLLTWRHLYVAGRLHKPVAPLTLALPRPSLQGRAAAAAAAASLLPEQHHHHSAAADQLDAALAANLRAAVRTALLLSPETFTLRVRAFRFWIRRCSERGTGRPIIPLFPPPAHPPTASGKKKPEKIPRQTPSN